LAKPDQGKPPIKCPTYGGIFSFQKNLYGAKPL